MNIINNKLLLSAIKAALRAGNEIIEVYNSNDFATEYKTDQSPLTLADKKAHIAIVNQISECNIPILSEEGKTIAFDERKKWDTFWLVDPLDGTKEFVKKNGEFTVNIALIEKQQPIMGVIYVPVKHELYIGIVGEGAWLVTNTSPQTSLEYIIGNAQKLPLHASQADTCRVVGSRSHMSDETMVFIEKLKQSYSNIEMVSMGSSLKICLVAQGSADIYPRFGPTMEWDTAAGHAIALAAGKKVTLSDEQTPLTYNKENLLNPWFIVQ
jgi:3'(2'), 5'-bisphosphate nucleotidase